MKLYRQTDNIGKAKYTVSKNDGIAAHNDGSLFWDIAIFKNKKNLNDYIKKIQLEGYKKQGFKL